jgi:hypothetical protein
MYNDHDDDLGFTFGDARRCPRHPRVRTSSPDGLFDAPCGPCEYALDAEDEAVAEVSYLPPRPALADGDIPF